jgi:hypothetical protein
MHRVLAIDVDILKLVVIGLAVLHVFIYVLIRRTTGARALSWEQGRIDLHIFPIFSLSPVEVEAGVVNLRFGGPFNNYFLNVKMICADGTTKNNIRSRKTYAFPHLTFPLKRFISGTG